MKIFIRKRCADWLDILLLEPEKIPQSIRGKNRRNDYPWLPLKPSLIRS